MPVLCSHVFFSGSRGSKVHSDAVVWIEGEEAGALCVEDGSGSLDEHFHMSGLHINNVKGTLSTADHEGEVFFAEAWERLDRVLVDVLLIRVIYSADDLPAVNDEEMFLTAVEYHLLGCILTETLDSFSLEDDCLSLGVDWVNGCVIIHFPSHAPGVLHRITLILVFAHCVSDFVVAHLEGHHPSFPVALVVWSRDVVLDEHSNSFILVVDFGDLFHLLIEDKCVLISEEHETSAVLSGWHEEGVSEHLAEIGFARVSMLLWLVPRRLFICTCEDDCLRRRLVASIRKEYSEELVFDRTASEISGNESESKVLSVYR